MEPGKRCNHLRDGTNKHMNLDIDKISKHTYKIRNRRNHEKKGTWEIELTRNRTESTEDITKNV
jgi:hypothetical protein